MWWILPLIALALILAGAVYLTGRIRRFSLIRRLGERRRWLSWLVSWALLGLTGLFALINVTTAAVVFLHLLLFFLLCDGLGWLIHKLRRTAPKRYFAGAAALALTTLALSAGWFFAHHVYETDWSFTTDKPLGRERLRIVEIADAHLGATLDGEEFADICARIQDLSPDLVVLAGDFVDDDSCRRDMERAARALGEPDTTYGVFFVYGNHDNGYFDYRDFSGDDLRRTLAQNNVTVLEDESVLLGDRVYLVGRRDRSSPRAEASVLTQGLDKSKYIILVDHQPNDYAAEAASGADLVLSGHTHGGHIFPAGIIGLALGANDRVYGTEVRGGTRFLVSSGVSGWAIPFKTGAISEFAVIDVTN